MSGINVELTVPCTEGCTSISQQFTVEPVLPNGQGVTWPTKLGGNIVDSFTLDFSSYDEDLNVEQYAEMIVTIPEGYDGWSFYGNGIENITSDGNCQYSVQSTLISPTVLKIKMSQLLANVYSFTNNPDENIDQVIEMSLGDSKLSVSFRYVMKYAPTNTIYMSQDPRFSSRR